MTPAPSHYDLLIHGGTVIDGTKAPRFIADIGVIDGHIAAIGKLDGCTADRTLDATGQARHENVLQKPVKKIVYKPRAPLADKPFDPLEQLLAAS